MKTTANTVNIDNTEVHAALRRVVGDKANLVDTTTTPTQIKFFVKFDNCEGVASGIMSVAAALKVVTGKVVTIEIHA